MIRPVIWSLKDRVVHGPLFSKLERHHLLIDLAAIAIRDIRATLSRQVQVLVVQGSFSLDN